MIANTLVVRIVEQRISTPAVLVDALSAIMAKRPSPAPSVETGEKSQELIL